jgi:hypothetical protein
VVLDRIISAIEIYFGIGRRYASVCSRKNGGGVERRIDSLGTIPKYLAIASSTIYSRFALFN